MVTGFVLHMHTLALIALSELTFPILTSRKYDYFQLNVFILCLSALVLHMD